MVNLQNILTCESKEKATISSLFMLGGLFAFCSLFRKRWGGGGVGRFFVVFCSKGSGSVLEDWAGLGDHLKCSKKTRDKMYKIEKLDFWKIREF